jgi:hypothetical protein
VIRTFSEFSEHCIDLKNGTFSFGIEIFILVARFIEHKAKVLVERWRQEYNHILTHSFIGVWTPSPKIIALMVTHEFSSASSCATYRRWTVEVVHCLGAWHVLIMWR